MARSSLSSKLTQVVDMGEVSNPLIKSIMAQEGLASGEFAQKPMREFLELQIGILGIFQNMGRGDIITSQNKLNMALLVRIRRQDVRSTPITLHTDETSISTACFSYKTLPR